MLVGRLCVNSPITSLGAGDMLVVPRDSLGIRQATAGLTFQVIDFQAPVPIKDAPGDPSVTHTLTSSMRFQSEHVLQKIRPTIESYLIMYFCKEIAMKLLHKISQPLA